MQTPNCLVPEIKIMNPYFIAILKTDEPGTSKDEAVFIMLSAGCPGKLLYLLTLLSAKNLAHSCT